MKETKSIITDREGSSVKKSVQLQNLCDFADIVLPHALRLQQFSDDDGVSYRLTVNGIRVRLRFTGKSSINTQLALALSTVADM